MTVPTEHAEQCALIELAGLYSGRLPVLKLLYAIPNGGHRSKAVAVKLKAEGVKAGVPDLCLPVARGGFHGLYVEMKRVKKGSLEPEQVEWIAALQEQGYRAVVCKGAEAAMAVILEYIRMDQK